MTRSRMPPATRCHWAGLTANPGQVLNQAAAVAISWVLAIVGTLITLKVVDVLIGLRATPEQEIDGLDLSMHGEEGYNLDAQAMAPKRAEEKSGKRTTTQ